MERIATRSALPTGIHPMVGTDSLSKLHVEILPLEHSVDEGHEPIRPKRIPSTIRSSSLHCPPRSKSNSVSFMADSSKKINASSPQSLSKVTSQPSLFLALVRSLARQLLDSLWLELNDLESITGFRRSAHDTSNTCSAALVSALLALTGHVKQVRTRASILESPFDSSSARAARTATTRSIVSAINSQ